MRRIFLLTTGLAVLTGFSGCESLLTENPEHILVTENFYATEGDALAAVTAVYNQLYMYERVMQLVVDLPTDDYKNGQGMNNPFLQDLEFGRLAPENQFVATAWEAHYDGVNRANAAITRLPDVRMDEALKAQLLGEAKFLRGLFYFNLVRLFGDVPLVLQDTRNLGDLNVGRESAEAVYQQVVTDLSEAAAALPDQARQTGRASAGAARALLAKVHLTRGEWPQAVGLLTDLVDNRGAYGYDLLDSYRDNWLQGSEDGPESVFSVQFMQAPGNGNVLMRSSAPRNRVPGIVGWEADIPTQDLYDAFPEGDERRAATLYTSYEQDGQVYDFGMPLFYKYFDPTTVNATDQSNANVHILRYADVLLMYAEALNEVEGPTAAAYAALNEVRRRALNGEAADLTGLDQGAFRRAVYEERRLELAMEAHRWFDLVRQGRLVEVLSAHNENGGVAVKAHHVLLPIPRREMDTNPNLTQNPGYDGG